MTADTVLRLARDGLTCRNMVGDTGIEPVRCVIARYWEHSR
jgi:hypothetical protein